jgi:hypothetical protein
MTKLVEQVDRQAHAASFDGVNLIASSGVMQVVGRSWARDYGLPASNLTPQSFLTPMGMTADGTAVSRSMTTVARYGAPVSALTPESFGQVLPQMQAAAAGTSVMANYSMVSGDYVMSPVPSGIRPSGPQRYDLVLDTFANPNAVEVWQGGVRVAATGQPYAPGGGGVGAAALVSGGATLSFDYDPSLSYEVRTVAGDAWARFSGSGYAPAGSPVAGPPGSFGLQTVANASSLSPAPLNLETTGAPSPNGVKTFAIDGGGNSGRVDLVFDASLTPDVLEIWHDGQRVAATGHAYAPGGGPVGAGAAVTGQHVISFDYDASKPHTFEVRVNENNPTPGAGWVVGALTLQDPAAPRPGAVAPWTVQSVTAYVAQDTTDLPEPLAPLSPETDADVTGSASYVVDGGPNAGRVDFMFDNFDSADVIEVWQGGVRIAATGRAYAPGGGAVGVGAAVSGQDSLSFDYDPAKGRNLEFRINAGRVATGSAWLIGGLVLQDPAAPLPPRSSPEFRGQAQRVRYPDVSFVGSTGGERLKIETRNLTSAGLGLAGLDWDDPRAVKAAIKAAIGTAIEAAQHLGSRHSLLERSLGFVGRLRDTLEAGVGNLVDADLAKESAKLQAAQVKQQLAVQTLGIANAQPKIIPQLFGPK